MPVNEEMVEVACAAEQQVTGRYNWPEEWMPELADEYRQGMRVFLATIVPFIEAAALEDAAKLVEQHGSAKGKDDCREQSAQIAALIRARIEDAKRRARI